MSGDRQTLEAYAARVSDYSAMSMEESHAKALTGFMADVRPGGHILDLGCGPGLQAAQMMAAGFDVTALDATEAFVAEACKNGVPARLGRFSDVTETAVYDGVWASFSLLHASRAAFPKHLAALHQALRPRGLLFLGMKLGTGEHRDALGRFYSYYSEGELRDRLAQAGFADIKAVLGHGKGLAGTDDPFILMTARS